MPKRFHDRSLEARLVDLFNTYYARIFKAARAKDHAALCFDLESFFSGSTGLANLFRGVQVGNNGAIARDKVLSNLAALKVKRSRERALLYKGLSELLDFLLFVTMESLSRRAERYWQRRVLTLLRTGKA